MLVCIRLSTKNSHRLWVVRWVLLLARWAQSLLITSKRRRRLTPNGKLLINLKYPVEKSLEILVTAQREISMQSKYDLKSTCTPKNGKKRTLISDKANSHYLIILRLSLNSKCLSHNSNQWWFRECLLSLIQPRQRLRKTRRRRHNSISQYTHLSIIRRFIKSGYLQLMLISYLRKMKLFNYHQQHNLRTQSISTWVVISYQ